MAREKTRPQAYWHSEEGRRELFERTLNVLKVAATVRSSPAPIRSCSTGA